jgi:hypothetical protein
MPRPAGILATQQADAATEIGKRKVQIGIRRWRKVASGDDAPDFRLDAAGQGLVLRIAFRSCMDSRMVGVEGRLDGSHAGAQRGISRPFAAVVELHVRDHGTGLLVLMVAVFRSCGIMCMLRLCHDGEQQTK